MDPHVSTSSSQEDLKKPDRTTDDGWAQSSSAADFVAKLSHELRTPLTAILGYAEMLCAHTREVLPPDQYRQLEIIGRSGQAMLRLISDVLDWSQLEAGRVTPQARAFTVRSTLQEYIEPLLTAAGEKALRFELEVGGSAAEFVTDPDLLRQVVTNLVSNALKYTDTGGVTVSVSAELQYLRIAVEDTGPGIPAHQQALVFEEFHRLESDRKEGTGLGLAIARGLVEVLGGHLYLDSEPGRGTRFHLQIPRLSETAVQEAPELPFPPHQEGARVLIVDDNGDNRELLRRYLEDQGYQTLVLESGDGAIETFLRDDPHLILMDLMMPGLDGFETTRRLRAIRTAEQLPIIAVTALSGQRDHDRALEAGCNACLGKPLNFKRLTQTIRQCLAGITA